MLLLVVYNGIIPTPSFMSNQLKFKVMVNKLVKKCSVKLNSRKQICLCFGNSTPFCIEGKAVDFTNFSSEERKKLSDLCLPTLTQYFHAKTYFDENIPSTLRHKWNLQLSKFVEDCNEALFNFPELQTKKAKDIALFVLGGCKEESLTPSITLGKFIDMVIDCQKEKAANPDSNNFQVYITLKNALTGWEGGNKLNQPIVTLSQSDFDNLSAYLKERKGKNGKKGANWERMMQCYRAVINAAISSQFNKITGCTEKNIVKFSKQNPNTQFKVRTGKSIIELYNKRNNEGAMTFEQVEAFKRIDPTTLCVKMRSTDRNNTKRLNNLATDKVVLCYDILSFMLYAVGIRPIDAIRISHFNFDWEHQQIVYLPAKKKRFDNDDIDVTNHIAAIPMNEGIMRIFEKYKGVEANGFLFPCPCNTKDNGKYNYKRINQFEGYMNAVIKAIGKEIGLNFIPTNYTMRKTAITLGVDNELQKAKLIAMEKVAKLAGTSAYQVSNTYYKSVNQ